MNIGEAGDFFAVLRGMESDADWATRDKAQEAAERLTKRANRTLGAGPRPEQVVGLLEDVHAAIAEASDAGLVVQYADRTVETAPAVGGLL
ncbi:hypothetical protein HMPREF0063_10083 [Aeromicrobium marinum DSM 15272]|uniref:Uncharacterized protein n=1 Tax=Aeromicrobium marinum DSM 15272 TaxID=585531 RepID=E2S7S6_9ACTN|nr:hypothetical protein [Aeromicrobium marinum]EFQ84742.1 hypothetical protein HMPREF0063_10083 [Aeromicrobium marinum DSM 15272]